MRRLIVAGVVCLACLGVARAEHPEDVAHLPLGTSNAFLWTPEQQLAAYRNIDKVWPSAVVKRGKHVLALPKAKTEIDPAFTAGGTNYTTASYMDSARVSGVIAIRHGKIVLERYGMGNTADDRWVSFSVTKSITSTLIGAAIRDGYIKSIDDPVARYIPEMKGSVYETVSVRQLLTMTSGVKWNENYADPDNDAVKVGVVPGEPGVNPVVSYMRKLTRAEPPGAFHYKTGETDLAGILVSSATGKPMADYLSENIWQPFGMERDAMWPKDAAGHERGGCCLAMTLRDYGRFGLFMLGGGKARGKAVLPDGWVAEATSTRVVAEGYQPAPTGYGYFWWTRPMDMYEAVGVFGQSISIFPKDDLVVVVLSAWPQPTGLTRTRLEFVRAVRDAAVAAP